MSVNFLICIFRLCTIPAVLLNNKNMYKYEFVISFYSILKKDSDYKKKKNSVQKILHKRLFYIRIMKPVFAEFHKLYMN